MSEHNPSMVPHNPTEPKYILSFLLKKNTKSITFILLSSLPLLCFMILYETFLEKNLIDLIKISIPQSKQYFFEIFDWPTPTNFIDNLTWQLSKNLILLSLMYFPLSLLHLVSMIITVDLASKIYKEDEPISLKNLTCRCTSPERLKGQLTTFMYTFFLSTCGFLGNICFIMILFYAKIDSFFVQLVSRLVYPAVMACLLLKYLELSVVWNLSSVVSVLEGEYGASAFALSFYFCEGKKKRGVYLMLGYILVGIIMRIPCFFYVDDGWVGLVMRTSVLWFAALVKWVGFVVYHHECKSRAFMKIDANKENEDLVANVA